MPEEANGTQPFAVYDSYAQQDEALHKELETHLSILQRQHLITSWHQRNISPGTERTRTIDQHLSTAHIILLLISPDFLASDFCYSSEMTQALARHDAGEARVIPILIRPVSWEDAPFSKLQILPRDGIPVTSKQWESRDDAWLNVVKELRSVIADLKKTKPPQVTAPSPRIWHVPHRRNPFFTGREDLLKQLHDRLTTNRTAALTQPQAISGLGGIGKTQTALEYAYRYQQQYRTILWVSAATPETLQTDFAKLAQVIGLPIPEAQDPQQTVGQVKSWLAQNQDWLLILDNADDLESASAYFPESNSTNGHIILTSRAQAAGSLAAILEVEEMTQTEGALLLLRCAGILSQGAKLDQATAKAKADAEAIVQELDGLPLAIDQAGAYIEETGCGLSNFLELYEKRRNELLAHRGHFPPGHSEPVATTWDLSFRLIEQANPAAADLLRLCAFLNPDAIPESLITEGADELGPALSALAEDNYALNQAIAEVRKYSLLRRKTETQTLSMHRLVQTVLKDQMDEQTQRLWAKRAIKAMNRVVPEKDVIKWQGWQPYLAQVQACATLSTYYRLENTEAANLFDDAAGMLRMYAYYEQAEPLYQRALTIREKISGPKHPETAVVLNNLALLYHAQGKYEQAEPLYLRARAIHRGLGDYHPSTVRIVGNLALLYRAQGKYGPAKSLYQVALKWGERIWGPEHSETATFLNNLAYFYSDQGKFEQAEPLYLRALAIREKALGPEHPGTATTLNNLALLYRAQGKFEQAEPLYLRALAIREKVLGPEHPETATLLSNLAFLYHAQGKFEQAEPLYLQALAIKEKILGPEHFETATLLSNLTAIYREQGKYQQAEPLYEQVLAICEKMLGPEHPGTTITLNNLAFLYRKQGKYEQAEPLYLQALAIKEKISGSEHSSIAVILVNLARCYREQGKYEQAEPLYQRAITIDEKAFGIDHPEVAADLESYAILLLKMGRNEEAATIKARAEAIQAKQVS